MNVEIGEDFATFRAEPEHGRPVTFEVRWRRIDVASRKGYWYSRNIQPRFIVGLKGSNGEGFSHHTQFEAACKAALSRASRYEKAYSKPRGILTEERAA